LQKLQNGTFLFPLTPSTPPPIPHFWDTLYISKQRYYSSYERL